MITELDNIAIYFEKIQPISESDGFIECLYSEPDEDSKFIEFSFYFSDGVIDEKYDLFIVFLENNVFFNSKVVFPKNLIEISINIPKKDIKK